MCAPSTSERRTRSGRWIGGQPKAAHSRCRPVFNRESSPARRRRSANPTRHHSSLSANRCRRSTGQSLAPVGGGRRDRGRCLSCSGLSGRSTLFLARQFHGPDGAPRLSSSFASFAQSYRRTARPFRSSRLYGMTERLLSCASSRNASTVLSWVDTRTKLSRTELRPMSRGATLGASERTAVKSCSLIALDASFVKLPWGSVQAVGRCRQVDPEDDCNSLGVIFRHE